MTSPEVIFTIYHRTTTSPSQILKSLITTGDRLPSSDIFPSDFWDFDQDALLDGPIQGLAGRSKTTVLYLKANCSSLLYHRAYRKWKEFAVTRPFNGNVFPI